MHALDKQDIEQASVLPFSTPFPSGLPAVQDGHHRPAMARFRLFATMASALFLVAVLFQLAVNFVYPVAPSVLRSTAATNGTANATAAGDFLLGVGKGDITG